MNIVVIDNYIINKDKIDVLQQMRSLVMESFRKHLLGDWEFVLLDGDFSKHFKAQEGCVNGSYKADNMRFEDSFKRVYKIWKENNNVYFISGVDSICVKDCMIFGEFDHFSMFWATIDPDRYGFEQYLNSGLTYFPKSMDESLWEYGFKLWEKESGNDAWYKSQVIYNKMFYRQDIPLSKVLRNDLHWSPWTNNAIKKKDACIIHYHASKGLEQTLKEMKKDWIKYG